MLGPGGDSEFNILFLLNRHYMYYKPSYINHEASYSKDN